MTTNPNEKPSQVYIPLPNHNKEQGRLCIPLEEIIGEDSTISKSKNTSTQRNKQSRETF